MSYLPYAPKLPNVCFHLIFEFVGRSLITRHRIAALQSLLEHKPLYFSSYDFIHNLHLHLKWYEPETHHQHKHIQGGVCSSDEDPSKDTYCHRIKSTSVDDVHPRISRAAREDYIFRRTYPQVDKIWDSGERIPILCFMTTTTSDELLYDLLMSKSV